ncbi:G patch domain-containing protein 8 [Pseudocercospora fuligena]|uniref:G patch domain-containing protein 8 n=1 Tax=Pseudocercospora fuligena TaxID=685502 RepID=A0A8H6VMC0_9PEZI|nr:G patch domain-containing protein 8 [Pseudocercospora fuligena]
MAPRGQALPQAATESAREARKSFFCELCQKGYARMNEFEAHEGSYDHQHRKRLMEMRKLTKDPSAAARARAAEERQNAESGLKSISVPLGGSSASSGQSGVKKKPVFKSTLQPQNAAIVPAKPQPQGASPEDPALAIYYGWHDRAYDPEYPTKYVPL